MRANKQLVVIAPRKIIWNVNAKKKENMIILTENSKMERRLVKNPPGSTSDIEPSEPPTTLEEAKQSFEDNKQTDSTPEKREANKKMKPKENQPPATQKNNVNKDSGKRPLSEPYNKQKFRKKTVSVSIMTLLLGVTQKSVRAAAL